MDRDLIAKSDPYCVIKCGPVSDAYVFKYLS